MKYAEKNAISKQFESENFLLKEERMLKQSKTAGFTLLHGTSPLILFDFIQQKCHYISIPNWRHFLLAKILCSWEANLL